MSDTTVHPNALLDADKVTKKRVEMSSALIVGEDELGNAVVAIHKAVDYIREDILDAFVAAARNAWQHVDVSEEYDAGPAGYHGQTHVPAELDHPLAGQTFSNTYPDGVDPLELPVTDPAAPAAAADPNLAV